VANVIGGKRYLLEDGRLREGAPGSVPMQAAATGTGGL
jgi:hypothetical protein